VEKVKLKAVILTKEITKIFKKFGLTQDHAKISAKALINAELVGAYGHGLSRLKMYCDRISKKVINPKPKIKLKRFLNQFHILMPMIVLDLVQLI
jgi:Malate/L-lactate dehydrogenases